MKIRFRFSVQHVLLALFLGAMTAACTRVSTGTHPAGMGFVPGTLRYSITTLTSLNPLTQPTTDEVILDNFIYGWFFYVDDQGRFVPDLALEVPTYRNGGISTDGRTLTYHLRRGARWQDGAPFTAHDVAFTVHAVMNPRNNAFSRAGWDDIAAVETPDDYTVRFHLRQPYSPAIATLFCPYQHSGYPVLPAHLLERYASLNQVPFNGSPIGTGPFKVKEWVRGDHVWLVANPLYWRGPPRLKNVIVKIIPDDNTKLFQFKTHELDAIFAASTAQLPEIEALRDARVTLVPTPEYELMALNTRHPPLDDVRVRQAIDYAIDKHAIIDNVTHGVGVPAAADVARSSWAYDTGLVRRDHNPAAAAALLDEAGWMRGPDGIRQKGGRRLLLTLTTIARDATRGKSEIIVQDSLRTVGIESEIKNYPSELIYAIAADGGVISGGKYDMAIEGQNTGVDPDDSTLFMCDQMPPAGVNDEFWCDPTFDAAERRALSTYDEAQRRRFYAVTQRELLAQLPVIFLYDERIVLVASPRLHGLKPTPSYIFNWNTWEWSME